MVKNHIWNPLLGGLENKIDPFVSGRSNVCHNVAVLVTVEQKAYPSRTWQLLSTMFHEL